MIDLGLLSWPFIIRKVAKSLAIESISIRLLGGCCIRNRSSSSNMMNRNVRIMQRNGDGLFWLSTWVRRRNEEEEGEENLVRKASSQAAGHWIFWVKSNWNRRLARWALRRTLFSVWRTQSTANGATLVSVPSRWTVYYHPETQVAPLDTGLKRDWLQPPADILWILAPLLSFFSGVRFPYTSASGRRIDFFIPAASFVIEGGKEEEEALRAGRRNENSRQRLLVYTTSVLLCEFRVDWKLERVDDGQ